MSSASRMVTDIGGNASSTGPSKVSMPATVVVSPDGSTMTSSPGAEHPAGDPAGVARGSRVWLVAWGRTTHWTGNRGSIRLRSEAMYTVSRWCSSDAPSYQGMLADRWTTLSPCRAEIGMKVRSAISSRLAKRGELLADGVEDLLVVVDQVHLVDADQQVGHPQQRGQEGVPAGLLDDPLAGVDQDHGQVGGGVPGDHVAGVLDVSRGCRR